MEYVFGDGLRCVVEEVVGLVAESRGDGVDHVFFLLSLLIYVRDNIGYRLQCLKIMRNPIGIDYRVCVCQDNWNLIYAISRFCYYFYSAHRLCMVGKPRR
jgi:hypothetical protein